MNCDFVEDEYFYNQLCGQGEKPVPKTPTSDPLSWSPTLETQISTPLQPVPLQPVSIQPVPLQPVSETPNPVTEVDPTDEANNSTTGLPNLHDPPSNSVDIASPSTPSRDPEVSSNEYNDTDHERQESENPTVSGRNFELPPRSTRGVPPKRYSPDWKGRKARYSVANLMQGHLSEMARAFETAMYEEEEIPQSAEEAMKHKHWREAMRKEMDALIRSKTWEKCPLPEGKKPVGCRWIFTIKRRADGSIERYKARLVAKGYTQVYGIHYEETFSPVAKMNTVRTLLSVAACKNWELHQFDVTNAFLHGELKEKEEVYMDVPPGYAEEFGGQVCRLRKTLYGLKQSPRVWFGRFAQAMKKSGYTQSNSDHTLFLKRRTAE